MEKGHGHLHKRKAPKVKCAGTEEQLCRSRQGSGGCGRKGYCAESKCPELRGSWEADSGTFESKESK